MLRAFYLVCALLATGCSTLATAADAVTPDTIVAKVAGKPITAGDVQRLLLNVVGNTPIAPESQAFVQAQVLEQLVTRELLVVALDEAKFTIPDADIEAAVKDLERQAPDLDKQLAARGLTREKLRDQLAWELRWKKYLESQLTTKDVEAYFEAHRAEFDGTEVRVSHILLRAGGVRDTAGFDATMTRARQLRDEIASGKTTFADAARQYSAGPSRERGGDLGFIPRRERMVEAFSSAAFALKKGEISDPVVTYFGVHLILCTEVKPGNKTWQEAQPLLVAAVARERERVLADGVRGQTPIEYTGAMPYIDAQTGKVRSAGR